MGATGGGEEAPLAAGSNEENIFVSVRVRPLNSKEISKNDVCDWECVNENTILYKNANLSLPERSMYPTSYTFDRVFSAESSTRQVYNEGAKQVALSVVNGVNSSIFAYGQTSSGKTYTMTGITEYTIADIYNYVQKHTERDFILKFSAMEIYNESVRDLLSVDTTPLRLLDDPERGTIVEKLTEETIRDWNHVFELLSICEAQRQIGETSLNETSSRSHQIIRVTIESSAREFLGSDNSSTLVSTVNFVDLSGSERASQTLLAGTRLKEGCHINRSLLTLGTVIRKLSKGRNGHIPYRDSKLTRILHSSLGGNARTAIICTMSPARIHVEQSRNTLLFASCAKEVTTNAQITEIVSDKALIKHLQRELARLQQSGLRILDSSFDESRYATLLQEKDSRIEKLEKELKDVIAERDLAQSQVQDLLQVVSEDDILLMRVGLGQYPNLRVRISPDPLNILRGTPSIHSQGSFRTFGTLRYSNQHSRTSSEDNYPQIHDFEDNYSHNGPSPGLFISDSHFSESDYDDGDKQSTASSEDSYKDVECTEIEESKVKIKTYVSPKVNADIPASSVSTEDEESAQVSIVKVDAESIVLPLNTFNPRSSNLSKSRCCTARIMDDPSSPRVENSRDNEGNTPPNGSEKELTGRPRGPVRGFSALNLRAVEYQSSEENGNNILIEERNPKDSDIDDVSTTDIKEVAMIQHDCNCANSLSNESQKSSYEKSVRDIGLDPIEEDKVTNNTPDWSSEFKRLQKEIIQLWHTCNLPLAHRAYFFLLFKGDTSDSIYMEVELRKLSFLDYSFSHGKVVVQDGQTFTPASSLKALRRERQMLSKQMQKRLTEEERESLFVKWGVKLNSKNRRLQLADRLWSDTENMEHITNSALLVAKLAGFVQPDQTHKEMFALNFSPALTSRTRSIKSSFISLL